MSRLASMALVGLALTGCVADKGVEDDPLGDDGKADSFYSPTNHGALMFGPANRAEFTDDEHFHAWTFTLDGSATVSIRTQVSNNLDTVLYLYRRDVGSTGSYGPYIEKNDDAEDGEMYSRIDLEGTAGEYRIIVKAFKTAQRGPLSVLGTCTGAGCPGPSACVADMFGALPDATDQLSAACATNLLDAFTTRTTATNATSVAESEVCSLDGLGKQGVDLYRAYWQDVMGWDEFKSGEEDIALDVDTATSAAGTHVGVDAPFDEDAMSLVFDEDGTLLLLYQSNQSADSRTFCEDTGTIAAPDTGCVVYMRGALPHAAAEQTGSGTTTCNDARNDLPPLTGDPVCEFTYRVGIADAANVAYAYRTWRSDEGYLGATVTLTASGHTGTYTLGTTWADTTKIFASNVDGTFAFDCLEL